MCASVQSHSPGKALSKGPVNEGNLLRSSDSLTNLYHLIGLCDIAVPFASAYHATGVAYRHLLTKTFILSLLLLSWIIVPLVQAC